MHDLGVIDVYRDEVEGGGEKKPLPSLPTDLDDSTPRIFCRFCLIDMVHRMYKKRNEQSVKSSPFRLRCEMLRIQLIGSNGSLATTRPSNLENRHDNL